MNWECYKPKAIHISLSNWLLEDKQNISLLTYGKFHMDLVNSLSMMEKMASTSPLDNRSGAFSRCQRMMRAKPCWGPKLHGPNWATTHKTQLLVNSLM